MPKKYSYYPGCSMHSSGKDFEESLHAVSKLLEIDLKELPDWNCCGASSTHLMAPEITGKLSIRNLEIADREGLGGVVTACPACYAHLKHGEHDAKKSGAPVKSRPRHIVDVLHEDIGLDAIEKGVKHRLEGLKAVSYYGCLMVRPPELVEMDNPEDPVFMDDIVEALGGEAVYWSHKTDCCGGGLAVPRTDVVLDLVGNLFTMAEEAGANCVVVACPLCHVNLDTREAQAGAKLRKNFNMPIYYITELMGAAFGLPEYPLWLGRHFVDPMPLLESILKAPAGR